MSAQRRAECAADRAAAQKLLEEQQQEQNRPKPPAPYTHALKCGTWYHYGNKTHHYFRPLAKSPTRIIEGWATTGRITTNDHALNPMGAKISLPAPLLVSHGRLSGKGKAPIDKAAVGEIFEATCSERGVFIRASIPHTRAGNYTWEKIVSGELRELSVGSSELGLQGVVRGTRFHETWRMAEVSLCPNGACPGAVVTRFYEA